MASVLAVTALVVSCGITELESTEAGGSGIWVDGSLENGNQDGGQPVISESCYVTTIEYPRDYDWRKDLEKGTVKCSLVVYINGVPRMKLAVGDAYHISSDVDMHRIVDGDLYTDYSTDSETIIKKNGVEIFRWEGRETIKGLIVVDTDVYTLSQSRSGKGFSMRKNGQAVMVKENGYLFGHLGYDSENGVSFSFCEALSSQGGDVQRCYVVKDKSVEVVGLRGDIDIIWDLTIHDGKPCYIASMKGSENLLFVDGDETRVLKTPTNSSTWTAQIFVAGESVYVESVLGIKGYFTSMLWKDGQEIDLFDTNHTVSSFCESGGSYGCVLNYAKTMGGGAIYKNHEKYKIPDSYLSSGNYTTAFVNGMLYVGLTSIGRGNPMLWIDGETETMNFNGFIASVNSVKSLSSVPKQCAGAVSVDNDVDPEGFLR